MSTNGNYYSYSDLIATQERQFLANENRTNRNFDNVQTNINLSTGRVIDAVDRYGTANLAATERVGQNLGIQAEKLTNETITYLADNFQNADNHLGNFQVATARDFGFITRDLQSVQNNINQQSSAQFAQLQLQAANNKSDLESKLMECCCSIKEKISGQGIEQVRDSLRAAEQRNIVLEARAYAPPRWFPPPGPFPPQ